MDGHLYENNLSIDVENSIGESTSQDMGIYSRKHSPSLDNLFSNREGEETTIVCLKLPYIQYS